MDMQREDFLKLCKLPKMVYYPINAHYRGDTPLPTRTGMGFANLARIIDDWFPQGEIVSLEGCNFISRGIERPDPPGLCRLSLLNPKTLQASSFSIFEALALADLSIKGAKQ